MRKIIISFILIVCIFFSTIFSNIKHISADVTVADWFITQSQELSANGFLKLATALAVVAGGIKLAEEIDWGHAFRTATNKGTPHDNIRAITDTMGDKLGNEALDNMYNINNGLSLREDLLTGNTFVYSNYIWKEHGLGSSPTPTLPSGKPKMPKFLVKTLVILGILDYIYKNNLSKIKNINNSENPFPQLDAGGDSISLADRDYLFGNGFNNVVYVYHGRRQGAGANVSYSPINVSPINLVNGSVIIDLRRDTNGGWNFDLLFKNSSYDIVLNTLDRNGSYGNKAWFTPFVTIDNYGHSKEVINLVFSAADNNYPDIRSFIYAGNFEKEKFLDYIKSRINFSNVNIKFKLDSYFRDLFPQLENMNYIYGDFVEDLEYEPNPYQFEDYNPRIDPPIELDLNDKAIDMIKTNPDADTQQVIRIIKKTEVINEKIIEKNTVTEVKPKVDLSGITSILKSIYEFILNIPQYLTDILNAIINLPNLIFKGFISLFEYINNFWDNFLKFMKDLFVPKEGYFDLKISNIINVKLPIINDIKHIGDNFIDIFSSVRPSPPKYYIDFKDNNYKWLGINAFKGRHLVLDCAIFEPYIPYFHSVVKGFSWLFALLFAYRNGESIINGNSKTEIKRGDDS